MIEIRLVEGRLPADVAFEPPTGCGAVARFDGRVRAVEGESIIRGLHYEAYEPMARSQLERLAAEAIARFGVVAISVWHSTGFVPVAECSFTMIVASKHRKASLEAMDWFIDAMKRDVPIWKEPVT